MMTSPMTDDNTAALDAARTAHLPGTTWRAGVAIGPVIGSASTHISHRAPGLVAAVLCVINVIFASKYLVESHDMAEAKKNPGGIVMDQPNKAQ